MSSSFLDDAYVALRRLLGSRTVSPTTREQIQKTIRSINQEALRKTVLEGEVEDGENGKGSSATD
ncbi:MAG TPA: hypothetical protein VMU28_09635 [Terriglobales bacterium]|nr:hypothetical protein [Terriglobales bacterium]